jgi:hypothetical protein
MTTANRNVEEKKLESRSMSQTMENIADFGRSPDLLYR